MRKGYLWGAVMVGVLILAGMVYAQEAEQVSAPPTQKVLRVHQVKAGENLHLLSAYYYGDARQWKRIWELNRKEIKNPNRINVGQMLKIEVEPGWTPKFDLEKFIAQNAGKMPATKKVVTKTPTVERTFEEVKPTMVPRLLEGGTPRETKPEGRETPPPETEAR